ncbi:hypothetical protein [Thermopolyspora flexuosa]|uniref:hypothetical protein n=1 Tax=Thermopolyspora flexuosa TaxID=103836 RepID=UPI00114E3299|nr:hypothetical protein [Thermopolyspora flexuosa]
MNRRWERNTSDTVNVTTTVHPIGRPGGHTLKCRMADPAVILQRLEIDTGRLEASHLDPPESMRAGR